jgi:uncharacterized phage infection (PIP) family protein YhgE
MTTARATTIPAVALAVVLMLSACGGDDTGSDAAGPTGGSTATTTTEPTDTTTSPGPDTTADVCAARDDLEQSIQDLRGMDVVAGGTDAVEAALGDVRDDLAALRTAAGSDLQDEVSSLESAIEELQGSLDDGTEAATGEQLTALAQVVTAGGALVSALQDLPCD